MSRARDIADGKFANDLTVDTNTLKVDSTNNRLGIGTASPGVKFELNNGGAGSMMTITDGVSTNFNFSTSGTVGSFGTDAGSTDLALKTSGSEKVRITSAGNVGINTGSPSGANLEIFTGSTAADGLKINRFNSGVYYSTLRMDSHGLAFHVGDGSNISERAAITPNGITFGGDTASANALDDYEEGTFTPTYVGFSISSVSSNNGRYTKIGNTVMVQVDLQDVTWTSGTGHLGISNLPFAGGAQRAFTGTFAWYYLVNNLGTSDSLAGYVAGGASSMMMYASQNGHIWHTIVTPSSGNNGYFNGTFWYRT